jgi:hypothetical protein
MLYSGMFLGILPNQPGISWESHLIGAIVGILVSFIFRQQLESDEARFVEEDEPVYIQDADEDFFLDRDTFEKTKSQRTNQNDWFSDSTM